MRESIKKVKYVLLVVIVLLAVAGCGRTKTADQNTELSKNLSDDSTAAEGSEDTGEPAEETETPEESVEETDSPEESAEETERWYGIFNAGDYVLRFPPNWLEKYEIEVMDDEEIVHAAFYAKGCHQETGEGWLFSIGVYTDNSYEDMPAYEIVAENNGVTYVAIYPTDVQTEGASKAASEQYYELMQTVEEVTNSLQPLRP